MYCLKRDAKYNIYSKLTLFKNLQPADELPESMSYWPDWHEDADTVDAYRKKWTAYCMYTIEENAWAV